MGRILLAGILLFTAATPASGASWVFFRDRGALAVPGPARDVALREATARITPRALARRAKAAHERGTAPADVDLPPDPSYIAAVTSRGGSIRTVYAWLNAISVEAPVESLARIEALPLVARVRPVAEGATEEAPAPAA